MWFFFFCFSLYGVIPISYLRSCVSFFFRFSLFGVIPVLYFRLCISQVNPIDSSYHHLNIIFTLKKFNSARNEVLTIILVFILNIDLLTSHRVKYDFSNWKLAVIFIQMIMSRATARKRDSKSLKSSETGMFGSSNNGLQLASQVNGAVILSTIWLKHLSFGFQPIQLHPCNNTQYHYYPSSMIITSTNTYQLFTYFCFVKVFLDWLLHSKTMVLAYWILKRQCTDKFRIKKKSMSKISHHML